jgi:hypothetical protein
MRILQEVNYIGGLGADRWIVGGYHDAFEALGHEHFFWTASENLARKLDEVEPDVLMIGGDRLTYENLPMLLAARKKGAKIFLFTDAFALSNPVWKDIILNKNVVDIYHGETEPEWMRPFEVATGMKYHHLPNAANAKYHFPATPTKKYQHDIVFLGAMMPNKRAAFEKLLLPLRKRYDVKIYGPNWTVKDNAMRLAALASRKIGMYRVNEWVNKLRLSVPLEEENQLYSSAKICLNIHERGEHIKSHVILNERTFKIPACGGFEICDFVPPLRRYFAEDEVVMASQPLGAGELFGMGDMEGVWVDDWFKKIDYYLNHDAERKAIQAKGTARALRDHTYHARAKRVLELAGFSR